MTIKRKKSHTSISDEQHTDPITSLCHKCLRFGIYSYLGERVYNENELIPSDHDFWLQCHRCGLVVAKVHAERQTTIKGFVDPPKNIHDSGKVVVLPINNRSKEWKEKHKAIVEDRNTTADRKDPLKQDKDLQRLMSDPSKKLINYSSTNDNEL